MAIFRFDTKSDEKIIQGVPLPTKPDSSLIILPLMRILQLQLGALQAHSFSFLTQRTYSCSNLVAISSLVLELLKNCRVWKVVGHSVFEIIAVVHRLRRLNDSKFTTHTVVVCRYATYTDREQV